MKKLLKISALIAAMALSCAFFGCSNGNSSDDNNSNSGGSTTSSFDDCTNTATEVSLTDGTWTVKAVQNGHGLSSEMNIKASVSNGDYTFTSGTAIGTFDLATQVNENELANKTDEEKKELLKANSSFPDDATITINGTLATVTYTLNADRLAAIQSNMDLQELPNNATVKTNSDNTKYIISYTKDEIINTIYTSKD